MSKPVDSAPEADEAARAEIAAALRRLKLVASGETPVMTPLTGGVSSDIWKVELASGTVCVKRALARLKVKQVWEAPVKRNAAEVAYLRTVAAIAPDAVPRVLAHDEAAGLFVMEFLDATRYSLWKAQLLHGEVDVDAARAVGRLLVKIHAATARNAALEKEFANDDVFYPIRLEPYLDATARAHTDLAPRLRELVQTTFSTKLTLVHGDVSPKNILISDKGPVLLDAECAWYGDPAFDLAFCLNHLLLKCLKVPQARVNLIDSFSALSGAYLAGVTWEPRAELQRRTAHLLPGLFLARIDGKSPVEYLTDDEDKNKVRKVARALLQSPVPTLSEIASVWNRELISDD